MSNKKAAPAAKKSGVIKYLPVIVLLLGLIIMTVCFIDVNNRANALATQMADLQTQLNEANAQLAEMGLEPTVVIDNTAVAEVARLQAELEETATALAEKTAELEVRKASADTLQAELDAANAALTEAEATIAAKQAELDGSAIIIAQQQVQLDDAAAALEQALTVMDMLTGK